MVAECLYFFSQQNLSLCPASYIVPSMVRKLRSEYSTLTWSTFQEGKGKYKVREMESYLRIDVHKPAMASMGVEAAHAFHSSNAQSDHSG